MANAEKNFKQDRDALIVQEIVVTEGRTLKRSVPVSRGRVHPRKKRTAHITVTVGLGEATAEPTEAIKEKAEKTTTKSTK